MSISSASEGDSPKRSVKVTLLAILWLFTELLAVGTIVCLAIKIARNKPEPKPEEKKFANVEVQTVKSRVYQDSLVLPARLEADRRAIVSSELAGRLLEWKVAEGATVEKGQLLALLNTDDLQAQLTTLKAQRKSAQQQIAVEEQNVELAKVSLEQAGKSRDALQISLRAAEANLDFSRKEAERIEQLARDEISTKAEIDAVENKRTQAQLAVASQKSSLELAVVGIRRAQVSVRQAEVALKLQQARLNEFDRSIEQLKVTLAKAEIRAPFSGSFEEHAVEAGDVVAPGEELARLYDLSYLRVRVDVPDRYAMLMDNSNPLIGEYIAAAMPGARQESKATILLPGLPKLTGGNYVGYEFPAKIHRLAQAANPASNTFRVELRLKNPGTALKEGVIVQAKIDFLSYDNAIVIPLSAVQVSDVGPRVLTVEEKEGKYLVKVCDVEPVTIHKNELLIKSGLKAGDRLIISGGRGVMDGERVKVIVDNGVLLKTGEKKKDEKQEFIKVPEGEGEKPATPAVDGDKAKDGAGK